MDTERVQRVRSALGAWLYTSGIYPSSHEGIVTLGSIATWNRPEERIAIEQGHLLALADVAREWLTLVETGLIDA